MKLIVMMFLVLFNVLVGAHTHNPNRPDAHAPISVMGEHRHHQGEWMWSYRYMRMSMSGLSAPATGYRMSPKRMSTDMHMLGAMVAPSDQITLMAMVPYLFKSMDMKNNNNLGMTMTNQSSGIGDAQLGMLVTLFSHQGKQAYLNTGISVPLGDIDQSKSGSILPYGMQLGSGTYDVLLGGTYVSQFQQGSLGMQLLTVTRLGTNSQQYRLGDRMESLIWGAKPVSDQLSFSARLRALKWQDISGADSRMGSITPATLTNQGGHQVQLGIGMNYLHKGQATGHRLATEVIIPLYQALDGIQLESDWMVIIGWQKLM